MSMKQHILIAIARTLAHNILTLKLRLIIVVTVLIIVVIVVIVTY